MIIAENSLVSVYSDSMAFLLILGLTIIPRKRDAVDGTRERMFFALCLLSMINALGSCVAYAVHGQSGSFFMSIELAAKTVLEVALLLMAYQWLMYVDYMLYRSRDQLARRYKYFFLPILILLVLLLVNLFTGVLFTIQPDMSYRSTWVYYVLMAVEYIYFAFAFGIIYQYSTKYKHSQVFRITPIIIPVILGTLVNILTDYSASPLGFAIGLVLLYFSFIDSFRYDDEKSGYYNRSYLVGLVEGNEKGADAFCGAICFEASGDGAKELPEILRSELPAKSTIAHIDGGRYILLTRSRRMSDLGFIADMVEDAAEGKVSISTQCFTRGKDQSAAAFIKEAAGV